MPGIKKKKCENKDCDNKAIAYFQGKAICKECYKHRNKEVNA